MAFPAVNSFLAFSGNISVSVIVLNADKPTVAMRGELDQLKRTQNAPIIILNDQEDPNEIVDAFESGVRGDIPTSVALQVAVSALRLVKAGGTFVPASSLFAIWQTKQADSSEPATTNTPFTTRQSAIIAALCRGKANKIIAYELNMCEST